jgi:DNA-binding response OmpR family regulator
MARILIIDDEQHVLDLYSEELKEDGYDVLTMDSGRDALYWIGKVQPDLVILDIRLIDADGLELARAIRNRFYDLPVVLNTAYDSFRHDLRAMAADYYVVKSFDLQELKSCIRRCLEAYDLLGMYPPGGPEPGEYRAAL